MSDINIKCVFCREITLQKTIKFVLETLQKCINVLEYRRSKPVLRKSRRTYDNLELSIESSLNEVYHAQCYKLFTAIKLPRDFEYSLQQQSVVEHDNALEIAENSSESHVLVSKECSESHATVSSTCPEAVGISTNEAGEHSNIQENFEDFNDSFNTDNPVAYCDSASQLCFICEKERKRYQGREVRLAVNRLKTINKLKSAATEQNDTSMLEKLSSFSDDSKIVYHKCCKDQYLREIYKDENSEFLRKKKVYNTAYTILCDMLEEKVVQSNECFFFDYIKKEYQKLLEQQYSLLSNSISISSFSDRHLERKLMETFDKKIKIIYAEKKKFLVPFSATLLTYKDLFKTMAAKEAVRSVATQLREEILKSTRRELPENLTAEDLMMGECDNVPELLTCFLETLISGNVSHVSKEKRDVRKNKNELSIFSIGQDLIYAAFGHKIKTSKHITLGLAVKSLCNSKKIINILSKYGHCCSYTTLEELETELTFSTVNSTHVCPEDILRRPDLNTGVAFDNFDRFVETLNGKDTLHDTVGIIFQDIVQNPDPVSEEAYEDVVITPDNLEDAPKLDTESEDEIEPEEEDDSTDEEDI